MLLLLRAAEAAGPQVPGLFADEERDEDRDGIPDIYEEHTPEFHLRMAAIYEKKAAERNVAQLAGASRDGADRRHDLRSDRHERRREQP